MNWVHYFRVVIGFLDFWKISRNRLAGDEPPPGDASGFILFWGSGAARRCMELLPVSGFG